VGGFHKKRRGRRAIGPKHAGAGSRPIGTFFADTELAGRIGLETFGAGLWQK
jgi:hypothetical protein